MWLKCLLVPILIDFSLALNYFVPEGQELIYKWKAEARAGTYLPVNYASQFGLEGIIRLQKGNNSLFVQIANLTYKSYNGILNRFNEYQTPYSSIPEEVTDLQNIFEIIYNDEGLVDNIATQNGEKEFSRNIKKAIGSIFQLEASVVSRNFSKVESLTFVENSVYGRDKVNYIVYPSNDSLEIEKIQDMTRILNSNIDLITNGEFDSCDNKPEELLSQGNRKTYIFCSKENVIRSITTSSTAIYYPFSAKSDAQYLEISQNFQLANVAPISESLRIDLETQSDELTYTTASVKPKNNDQLLLLVRTTLKEISQYSERNHINSEEIDIKNGQLVNRAQNLLAELNSEELQGLQKTLSSNLLIIFYQLLPLVDTDASILLIRDLVIDKAISEQISIDLLQNLVDNSRPLIPLLGQLEDLIYLNNSYSWELRKVAILRFGTIIHKSYLYLSRLPQTINIEELYGKYITEFLTKLKNSNDYQIQQVYILALRNTKLPLYRHLSPAFDGRWWQDNNLRYLSLWAATSSPSDSETTFAHLWPIFSNRGETTELRILAFLSLIRGRPSDSTLRMVSSYMLTEKNEEIYRFCYTYLRSILQSEEPCLAKLKLQVAQALKFTPPPRFGLSSASFFDYRDITYGFGTSFENYFIKTNFSRIYKTSLKTQQFSRYQEEFSLYLKIYTSENKQFSLTDTVADMFFLLLESDFKRSLESEKNFIEGAIVKRGQIINTYFYNISNIHELYSLFKYFTKPVSSCEILRIRYLQYHKATIPTELGIPASWEFLMPVVYRNNLTLSIASKFINMNVLIDNQHSASIHYRHGLSFYNPISDVWQGINRYQYFDSNLPLRFLVNYLPIPQAISFTWVPPKDSVGVRSYVKQVVFKRDRNFRGEFQTVALGKNFRHDYTLIDQDDPHTGLKFYLGAYDSSISISPGSFQRKMVLFGLPFTKQFNSISQYLLLTGGNLLRYFILLPQSGTYGIVAKLEASRKYPVFNNTLSLNYSVDYDRESPYAPGISLDFQVSHTARSEEQDLLSCTADANISIEAGHKAGTARMEVRKLLPDKTAYRIYFDAFRRYSEDYIMGSLNVTLGDNEGSIEVTESAQPSAEQKSGNYRPRSCRYVIPYSWPNYYPMDCLIDQTAVRHYSYEITARNVSNKLQERITSLLSYVVDRSSYRTDAVDDNSTRIEIDFPMQTAVEEVDFKVTTAGKLFQFTGVPNTLLSWVGVYPESTVYPKTFLLMQKFGLNEQWIIYADRYVRNGQTIENLISNNWTLYLDDRSRSEVRLYVKNVADNRLGFRIDADNRTLEVVPDSTTYESSEEGEVVLQDNYQKNWLYYRVIKNVNAAEDVIVAFLPKNGIHLEYYGDRLELSVANLSNY